MLRDQYKFSLLALATPTRRQKFISAPLTLFYTELTIPK